MKYNYRTFGSLSLQTVAELAHEVAQAHQFGGVGHVVYAVRLPKSRLVS